MVLNCAAALQALDDELYVWSRMGHRPCFWWRDDDACRDSLALQSLRRLLDREFLFLAVVPGMRSDDLVRTIQPGAPVCVLQHGWMHKNHAASGKDPSEFPRERPAEAITRELRAGQEILSGTFPGTFHRVFVPPWHRCADWVLKRATQLGFDNVSLESPPFPLVTRGYPGETNVEIDLCDWTRGGSFIGDERLADLVFRALKLRREWHQQQAPVGILAQHALVTTDRIRSLSALLKLGSIHEADG